MPPTPTEPRWYGPALALGKMLAPAALLLPVVVVLFEADTLSWSGWTYAASLFAIGVGLWRGPSLEKRWRPGLGTIGALVFALLAVIRIASGEGDARGRDALGPNLGGGRYLSRLFEERDGAILGARLLRWSGYVQGHELSRLGDVMAEHYPRMDAEGLSLGTPILATELGGQTVEAFDTYVFEPATETDTALVFLHGAGGSFALMCWQVARPATEAGLRAYCPAMSETGRWNTEAGRGILRALLTSLAERGTRRVVLAGLSNGSLALGDMAPNLVEHRAGQPELVGLVLVSGVEHDARPTELPTLLFHGREDTMTPIEPARRYAEGAVNAELVEVRSGHFAILEDHEALEVALGRFLTRLGRGRSGTDAR